jgi:type II secretory pathway component GspD/PulD (secretin)
MICKRLVFIISLMAMLTAMTLHGAEFEYDPFDTHLKTKKNERRHFVIPINYLNSEKVGVIFGQFFNVVPYFFDDDSRYLTVSSSLVDFRRIRSLIRRLDHEEPMIKISIKVLEFSKHKLNTLGLNFSVSYNGDFLDRLKSVNVDLDGLISSGQARVLAQPTLLTLSNKMAQIDIGEKIPYALPSSAGDVSQQWTVQYLNAGIHLDVIAQVVSENRIKAHLHPEVSSLKQWRSTQAGEFPVISRRELNLDVLVNDGQELTLGGLISTSQRKNERGVPILSDLPLVGWLFSNDTNEFEETEIVFLVEFSLL